MFKKKWKKRCLEKIAGDEKRREFSWKEQKCRDFKEGLVCPDMLTPHWTQSGEICLSVSIHTHKDFSRVKWKIINSRDVYKIWVTAGYDTIQMDSFHFVGIPTDLNTYLCINLKLSFL